ncbi:MAG: hypothetical protein JW917_05555 [Ignavibacteria bacterium]|nr:hypothetical protein [Ignavibacteria bacterium]
MSKFLLVLGVIFIILAYLFFKFLYLVFKVNKTGRDLKSKQDFKPKKTKTTIDKSKAVDAKYEEIK